MASQRLVSWLCIALLSFIGLSLQQKSDLRLEVEPHYIHVTSGTPVTVKCTLSDGAGARVPLAGCGFREYYSGAAWVIGTGSASISKRIRGSKTSALITSNREDAAGVCSLRITGLPKWSYILGCRVRPVTGAWRYAAIVVNVNNYPRMQYRLQPPRVLVSLPGGDVSISGLAEQQIHDCNFTLATDNTRMSLRPGHTSSHYSVEYRSWSDDRRCGLTLLRVHPDQSGFVMCHVWRHSSRAFSSDFVELFVATPPVSPPRLLVNTTDALFQAGDMLHATCLVEESRPVSNITWLFGGEVIRRDDVNEAPVESTWQWNHEPRKIIQQLSSRLSQLDNGKELKCRAEHLALPSRMLDSNTRIIYVRDACSPSPCGPHSKCSAHGSTATCSCLPLYIGKPPSCRPECVISGDCPLDKACVDQTCQDPCPMTRCGQDALCRVLSHVPTCQCPVGFSGDANTLCVPTDACSPSPCGPHSKCSAHGSTATCSCLPLYIGKPPSCRPECVTSIDCPLDKACVDQTCQDPCPMTRCGQDALCRVLSHVPTCQCPVGFSGDANTLCVPTDPCTPNPCGEHGVCLAVGPVAACSCQTSYIGGWPSCRRECDGNADCPTEKACVNHACVEPCPGDCGKGALCRVTNHTATCECPKRFYGDPHIICEEEKCGMRNTHPALISRGNDAKQGEFPWHVAIFKISGDGPHSALCGGTLIKPDVVITAAHCFYDYLTGKWMPSSSVKVAMGKLHLGWDVDLNDTEVQRFDVANLSAPKDYRGINDDFRHDIAVVKLATNATMTREVNVVCLDWGLRRKALDRDRLKTGDIGKVAGWGITYKSTERSPVLQWIDLPWVHKEACRLATHLGSRRFLTRDKFCAGFVNQSRSVCPGDSGGGLVFFKASKQRYYLKGVVSTSLAYNTEISTCYDDHYTAFTSVGDYIDWIIEQL